MKSYFLNLLAYDDWANQQIWQSINQKPLINPKIENLFSHLLSAQKTWLNRCLHNSENTPLWDTQPDLEKLMISNHQGWVAFIEKLNDDDFEKMISYQTTSGMPFETILKDILTHLINHGTYHRGQIVQLLKNERETLPATDYILWVR